MNAFDTAQGNVIYGGTVGNSIVKIDKNNNVLWGNAYNNYNTGSVILFLNNSIFVPYNPYVGLSVCFIKDSTVAAKESALNAGLLIDNITGNAIKDNIFFDRKNCGVNTSLYCYIDSNKYAYNIYSDDSFLIGVSNYPANYIEKIDSNFNVVSDGLFDPLNAVIRNNTDYIVDIIFDSINKNYIIGDRNGIQIYNGSWDLINIVDFHRYNLSFRGTGLTHIAYNANYYIASCTLTIDSLGDDTNYTVVLSKEGQLISCMPSFYFNDIFLTQDNNIFGISSLNNADTIDKPLTLVEMDLFQNIKRKVLLGKPGVIANTISVTNDNDVIVTGTLYFTGMVDSFPRPDEIYYYRQQIDEIPLLTNNGNNLCNSLNIYPNPTNKSINITSDNFDFTYSSTVEIYNLLGQKMCSQLFDSKTLSIDLKSCSSGIYFLKTRNSNASCVTKIEKL